MPIPTCTKQSNLPQCIQYTKTYTICHYLAGSHWHHKLNDKAFTTLVLPLRLAWYSGVWPSYKLREKHYVIIQWSLIRSGKLKYRGTTTTNYTDHRAVPAEYTLKSENIWESPKFHAGGAVNLVCLALTLCIKTSNNLPNTGRPRA